MPSTETAQAPDDAESSSATPEARQEGAYVAKPFRQEPPPAVDPDPERATEREATVQPGDGETDSARQETTRLPPVVPTGGPVPHEDAGHGEDGHGEDGHGDDGDDGEDGLPGDDDQRPGRRRILVLVAALCAVLLAVAAFQFGGDEGATPDPPAEESVAPTKPSEPADPSPSEPSADPSTTKPSPPDEPTAPASQPPAQPQPEQPAPGGGEPTEPATTAPPPATPTPEPEPTSPAPDPSDDCILILCL